ncbi:2-acylglycerol O-acyltransferase 2-like [Lycorma delicatula]|uniref:2-acylglycerol O-acyltransferase 2-like n=1 Tax=Lycorma delicatula TaxID=130591 RepID=UPI003F51468B
MQILGIQFEPLQVPLEQRLQTLAAGAWFCTVAFANPVGFISAAYLILYTKLRWIVIIYAFWIICDRDTANKGGRRIEWIRNWIFWDYYSRYFPLKLIKTAELHPQHNYLLVVYPHGLLSSGAFGHFATNSTNFKDIFPGIRTFLLTLNIHFLTPFYRDLVLGMGGCSVSEQSMMYLLDKDKKKGKALVLMAGGARESLLCQPGTYKIILQNRKGFIRIALQTGTSLVPVISFGEPDIFDQVHSVPGSWLSWSQNLVMKLTGFAPCVPIGRGLFQYNFGLVPRRYPITTVVGSPIYVEKKEHPNDEEIENLHYIFTNKLIDLFENNKHKYISNPDETSLIIL